MQREIHAFRTRHWQTYFSSITVSAIHTKSSNIAKFVDVQGKKAMCKSETVEIILHARIKQSWKCENWSSANSACSHQAKHHLNRSSALIRVHYLLAGLHRFNGNRASVTCKSSHYTYRPLFFSEPPCRNNQLVRVGNRNHIKKPHWHYSAYLFAIYL